MNPQPQLLVTDAELRLRWADAHGVRHDDAGESFDEIAQDNYATSDAHRELLAPDPTAPTSATHQAAANEHRPRAGTTNQGRGRTPGWRATSRSAPSKSSTRRGGLCPGLLSRRWGGEWESIEAQSVAHEEVMQQQDFPSRGSGRE